MKYAVVEYQVECSYESILNAVYGPFSEEAAREFATRKTAESPLYVYEALPFHEVTES